MSNLWDVLVGGLLTLAGTIGALFGKARIDRRSDTVKTRRSFYLDLLALLVARGEYMKAAIWDSASREPDTPNERIDTLNALLLIEATQAVTAKAKVCFELLRRFGSSRALNAPVERDDHGFYRYRFHQVAKLPDEGRDMMVRVTLGRLADEYQTALEALAQQIKAEVHHTR